MRMLLLYRLNSEHAGRVEDYVREYHARHPNFTIETMDADRESGVKMCNLYGVTNLPAVLALNDDGGFLQLWQDEHLPLMNELDFYQQA